MVGFCGSPGPGAGQIGQGFGNGNQPVALTLHALFSHAPQTRQGHHNRQRGEDAVTGIQQGWIPVSGRNCSITPSDTSERGDIWTWPVFTVLCSRVQASVVPITGRHLGERQMSVNFTCRPTIAAARLKLESEGL